MINIYDLNPKFYPNYLIKYNSNNSGILINCPAGTQKLIQVFNLNYNCISTIIITNNDIEYIEGLPGLLMSLFSANKDITSNILLITPDQDNFNFYSILNMLAQAPYWFGNQIKVFTSTEVQIQGGIIQLTVEQDKNQKRIIDSFEIQLDEKIYKIKKEQLNNLKIDRKDVSKVLQYGEFQGYKIQDLFNIKYPPTILYNIDNKDGFHLEQKENNYLVASSRLFYLVQTQQLTEQTFQELKQYGIIQYQIFQNNTQTLVNDLSVKTLKQALEKYTNLNENFKQEQQYQNKIIFLGTSASQPTKYRNVSGIVIQFQDHQFILDPGEQFSEHYQQLNLQSDNVTIITSHEHADHFLGICSLLKKLTGNVTVYTQQMVKYYIQNQINFNNIKFTEQTTFNINQYKISMYYNKHTIHSISLIIDDGNNIIYYSGDCQCNIQDYLEIFKQNRQIIIIHECTYLLDQNKEQAIERKHTLLSDLVQQVNYLKQNGVSIQRIILTHFSSRHQKDSVNQPKDLYLQAFDGMEYKF